MTLRPIPLALAAGAVLATIVACGGGGGGTSAPAPAASTPAPSTPAPSTPAPSTPAATPPVAETAPVAVSMAACAAGYTPPVAMPPNGVSFCASLATAPDANGMAVENGTSCRPRKAGDIVKEMGEGWNLGNTLDATGSTNHADPLADETAWGNPKTTKALIDTVRQAGFSTLRLPVSWDDHVSGADFTIDTAWMDRVEEVLNYALDNHMTVIVNIHHNNGWEAPTAANEANAKDRLVKLWTQIGTRFQHYDQHVVFEAMNEPRATNAKGEDDWNGQAENYEVINRLNAAALAAIRATGGNNARRLVMLPSYAAAPGDQQLNAFVLPSDPMIAVSSHAYYPYYFALAPSTDKNSTDKFTAQADIDALFARLNTKFLAKGIPVVLGEWGSTDRGNPAERVKHAAYYVKGAAKAGIPTVWWDNGGRTQNAAGTAEVFALLDRTNNTVLHPEITDAIFCSAK
jgi:endoglucanase